MSGEFGLEIHVEPEYRQDRHDKRKGMNNIQLEEKVSEWRRLIRGEQVDPLPRGAQNRACYLSSSRRWLLQ